MAITVLLSQSKAVKLFKYLSNTGLSQPEFHPQTHQRITHHSLVCTGKDLLLHSVNGGWGFSLKNKTIYLLKITCDSCDEQSHLKWEESERGGTSQDTEGVVGTLLQHTHTDLQDVFVEKKKARVWWRLVG